MKMNVIKTKPCICMETGKKIDCEQCLNSVMDNGLTELDNKKRYDHTPIESLKTNGCNHLPIAIDSKLKKVEIKSKVKKHQKYKEGLKTAIKCDCGVRIRFPTEKKQISCAKCNQVFALRLDRKHNTDRWMRVIACSCGNQIPYGRNTNSLKCFKCNHHYDRNGKVWEKQQTKTSKDTLTLADLGIKIKKRN